jgi:RHS repeat-associated protein
MILEETARAQGAKHPSTCEWRHQDTSNGELETRTNRDTGDAWLFQYDVLGNLLTVGLPDGDLVEYLVDAVGRRVGKKKNGVLLKQWIYREALKPAAELDGAGAIVAEFVYGSKSNVPDYVRRGGVTYRIISDHLGSPRHAVNVANSADVPFKASYSSFGVVTGTGLEWMPFGFAGGIYDGDSGLVQFGARDFASDVGRWSSKDSSRFEGSPGNLFVYVSDDPINLIDPTGRSATTPQLWIWGSHALEGIAGEVFFPIAAVAAAGYAGYRFGEWIAPSIVDPLFDLWFAQLGKGNVGDTGVENRARDLIDTGGAPDMCAALEILMDLARCGGDTGLQRAIKATQKKYGCRRSRQRD